MSSLSLALRRIAGLILSCATLSTIACQGTSGTPDRNPDHCFVLVASVTPSTPALIPADSVRLTASYNAVAAECLPSVPASALIWRSADAAIASVDSVRGEVTAHAAGVVQGSAYTPGGSDVLGSASIKVANP